MTVCHTCGQSIDAHKYQPQRDCQHCGHIRAVHVCKYVHYVEGEEFGRFCKCESFQPKKES